MTTKNTLSLAPLVALAAWLAACGGASSGAFSMTFPDNRADQIEAVAARIARAPAPDDTPVAVGVGGSPSRLFAIDLASGNRIWEQPAEMSGVPFIAGRLIFAQEGNAVVARDLASGSIRFTEPDQALKLVGAAGEGDVAVAVLSTGGGVGARSKLIVARGGSRAYVRDLELAMGVPAVRAGMLFIPWNSQNVSVLDAASGEEVARVRIADDVVGHALVVGSDVYVGQNGLYRFTPSIARGSRDGAAWIGVSPGELPGTPAFLRDAYAPPPAPRSATHRVRLDFRPTGTGESVALANDTLYYAFYRAVFALSPEDGSVKWAHEHAADVVGAMAVDGGLVVADARGGLTLLGAANGAVAWEGTLGAEADAVLFRGGSWSPPASGGEPMLLSDQLVAIAQNTDARLVPVQVYAVQKLTTVESEEAAEALITLCDRREAAEPVRGAACSAMAERVSSAEQLIAALGRHARFLEGTREPPVGALARAAARIADRRAVPHLVAHLQDPATPTAALPQVFQALGALGDASAAGPIRDFVRLYHADDADPDAVTALAAAIDAFVALRGPVSRELLDEIAASPFGIPEVRGKARDAIAGLERASTEAQEADAARQTTTAEETAPSELPEETPGGDARPMTVTSEMVAGILAPVSRELGVCLANAEGGPRSARLVLRLGGDGAIETLSVTPPPVQACVEPLVRAQTFPGNARNQRQQVIYTIRR